MQSRSLILFILTIAAVVVFGACDEIKDSVEDTINETAEQRQKVELRMDYIPVGVPQELLDYIPDDIEEDLRTNGLPAEFDDLLAQLDEYIQMAKDELGSEYVDEMIALLRGAVEGKFCLPVVMSIDDFMADESWWGDAKKHLEEVELDEVNYRVKSNSSYALIHYDFYLTDSSNYEQISGDEFFGSTDFIAAGENVDWTPMEVANDASSRIENLILDSDTKFAICATIPEIEDGSANILQVSQQVGVEVVGIVTFVPL